MTLLELLIVVAVLGVITALAVPNLMPTVARHRHHAQTVAVAGFVDNARRRAVADGRCYRVRLQNGNLLVEKRTSGDCVNLDRDNGADDARWVNVATLGPEHQGAFSIASATEPPSSLGLDAEKHRIVFRPSGRLWGDGDLDVSDDYARVVISQPISGVDSENRAIVVQASGRICVVSYGLGSGSLPAISDPAAKECP